VGVQLLHVAPSVSSRPMAWRLPVAIV
jgi:hypothetical protein